MVQSIMDKEEILKITRNLPDIIGVAPNAFSRVVPSEYFPNYSIVCFKYRGETDLISGDIEVFCVEKENPKVSISKMNAGEMLSLPEVQSFINSKKNPHLLVYKPTPRLETLSFEKGWKIIENSSTVKYDIENKLAFRNLLKEAGIDAITGETVKFDDLGEEVYRKMVDKYGDKLVFQVAEITVGGGTGTAFINSLNDFRVFMDKFQKKREKLTTIENVNVTKFIEGIPSSILACATKYGVIVGQIQTQILDVSDVRDTSEGSGLFSGHDFSYGNFDDNLNAQAAQLAKKFGEYIYKNLGYKGIFGMDLIVNTKEGKVYPIECNPRYTDAFPLVSEIHNKSGAIPMDVFHILEHMGVDFPIDVDQISDSYKTQKSASQIILETKTNDWVEITCELKAGVYRSTADGSISYLRPGYRFEQLMDNNEFLVTEGVPFKGTSLKGGSRILRLIFSKGILSKPKELLPDAKMIIRSVYEKLQLVKTKPKILVKDFLGLLTTEIPEPEFLEDAIKLNADVVNLEYADEDFGYVRPAKIGWGMDLTKDDPLSSVRAKKLKKHLKTWLNNMSQYGLRYEVKDDITSNEFALWFEKYKSLLSSKEKANIKINPLWITYKKKTGKKVGGIFLYKENKFLGGNVFTMSDDKLTVCYGIVERVKNPYWSFGAIIDYLCIKYAKEKGYNRIGFGQDNNLYGHHLSVGLLQYKLNLGLTPKIKDNATIYTTRLIKADKFKNEIVFLGMKNTRYIFYVLKKDKDGKELKLNTDIEIIEGNI